MAKKIKQVGYPPHCLISQKTLFQVPEDGANLQSRVVYETFCYADTFRVRQPLKAVHKVLKLIKKEKRKLLCHCSPCM
jgi:hypothetical protein